MDYSRDGDEIDTFVHTRKYLDDESLGLAWRYRPVVDISACPKVACTSEIGAL